MRHAQLRLIAPDINVDVKVDMGNGPATPSAGYAGWETVPRVRRRELTSFAGLPPFQQDVPIFLDGHHDNTSVERQLDTILKLGNSVVFRCYGPIFHSGDRFVFGGEPEFEEMLRAEDMTLIRARVTLKLMEYVPPDQAGRRRQRGKIGLADAVPLTYRTVKGDTLAMIAHKLYHDWKRWKEIAKKNGLSDPHRQLPEGMLLKL
jgi:hypothetical protein